jgi:hypothetical protein
MAYIEVGNVVINVPSFSSTVRDNFENVQTGMLIFNSTSNSLNYRNTTTWINV